MKIAQIAPLIESVPTRFYGGTLLLDPNVCDPIPYYMLMRRGRATDKARGRHGISAREQSDVMAQADEFFCKI